MEFEEVHPVCRRGRTVWARCPACRHYTDLVNGYYCRCRRVSWSACRCEAVVGTPVLRPEPARRSAIPVAMAQVV